MAGEVRLHPDEKVLVEVLPSKWWTGSLYIFTFGLWELWRRRHRYIVTDQRVIAMRGVISKSERSIPLARIQDVQLRRSPLQGGCVTFSTAGGSLGFERILGLTRDDALAVSDAMVPLVGRDVAGV